MITSATSATSPQSSPTGCSVPATAGAGGTCFYQTPSDPDPNPGDRRGPQHGRTAMTVTTTMTEIPIRHPSLHRPSPASGRRYVVDDVGLTLIPASSGAEDDPEEGYEDYEDDEEERLEVRLKGMASATVLDLRTVNGGGDGGPTVVSVPVLTSGLPERPDVLSLSVGDSDSGTAEIDLSKCSRFAGGGGGGNGGRRGDRGRGIVVRTECFLEDSVDDTTIDDDGGNDSGGGAPGVPVIRINMIDDECNVLSVRFLLLLVDGMDQLTPSPHPTSSVRFHPVGGWLKFAADEGRLAPPNPGARLSSRELVAYPSLTTIVIALPPLLACADLDTGEVVPWVDSTRVYDPNRTGRRSGVLGIAKNLVFGMFAGQQEGDDDDDDDWTDGDLDDDWGDDDNSSAGGRRGGSGRDVPSSTAALCAVRRVCSTGELDEAVEVALVFSLHSDGTLRKWTLPPHYFPNSTFSGGAVDGGRRSILPVAVHRLRISDASSSSSASPPPPGGEGGHYFLSLPRVNLWSPRHDAVSLCSTISDDGIRYRLAVAVRTSLPVVLDDAPEGIPPTTAFLALLGGETTGGVHHHHHRESGRSTEVVRGAYLEVPDDVVGTAGVAFCRGDGEVGGNGGRRELHCLFYCSGGGGSGGGRGGHGGYSNVGPSPPTNVKRAVIARYPIPVETDGGPVVPPQVAIFTLDRTAADSSASDPSSDYSVDAVVRSTSGEEEIDAWYLRTIFRSPSARSVGGTKPSDRTVRRALRRCCPHYGSGAMTMISRDGGTSGGGSIEAETLRAVREWRRQDEALATLASGGPGAGGLLLAAAGDGGGGGGVAAMEVEGEGEGGETVVADASSSPSSSSKTTADRRRVHCRRWQSLMRAIGHEEALFRRPLVIGSTSSSSSKSGGDGGGSSSESADGIASPSSLVVRCGVTSVVVVASSERTGSTTTTTATGRARSALDVAALSLLPGDTFSSSSPLSSSSATPSSSSPPPTPPRAGGMLRRQSSGQRAAAEERIRMYRRSLCALERHMYDVASSGQLSLSDEAAEKLRGELENVGLMAVQACHAARSVSGGDASSPEEVLRGAAEALDALASSDPRELLAWSGDVATELRLPPDGLSTAAAPSAAGTRLDSSGAGGTTTSISTTTAATSDERVETSSYLFGLYAESHRRLALGRCLLLSGLRGAGHAPPPFSVEAERTTLRTLLVCTAATCISAQPAGGGGTGTAAGKAATLAGRGSTSSSAVKLGRFASNRRSDYARVVVPPSSSSRQRTVLEEQIVRQMPQHNAPSSRGRRMVDLLASSTDLSLLSSRRVLARCVVDVTRRPDVPLVNRVGGDDDDREGGRPHPHPPRYLEQLDPRWVLRLLAPYVAIPLSTVVFPSSSSGAGEGEGPTSVETDRDGMYRIRTVAATCMLREAAFGVKFSTLSDERARELRVAACGVYRSAVPSSPSSSSSSSSSSSPGCGGDVDDVAATERARDRWGMSVVYNVLRGGRDHSTHGAADDGRSPPRDDDGAADARQDTVLDDATLALLMRSALLLPPGVGGGGRGKISAAADGGRALARLPSCRSLVSDWIESNSLHRPATGGGSTEAYIEALLRELTRQVGDMCDIYDTHDGDDHASGGGIPGAAPPPPPDELVGNFFRSMRVAAHGIDLLDLSERLTADDELMLRCALGASTYLSRESDLPENMVRSYMGETATLCSSSFRHAARVQRWDVAFASCRANPVAGRRRDDFRRLVVTMAECGAMREVLRLPYRVVLVPPVDGGDDDVDESPVDTLDLYEAAVAALQEKVMEQRERIRSGAGVAGGGAFSSSSSSSSSTNGGHRCFFIGCLYALYVSRGDWRRAAQVMDGWFEESAALSTKLAAGDEDMTAESPSASLLPRRRRCGRDIALAALSSSICVDLIEKESLRYVITGEHGEITAITAEAFGMSEITGAGGGDRLSRLKTATDLSSRALLSLAWNEIMETSGPVEMQPTPSRDEAIDLLAALGYYDRATTLATTLNTDENGGPAKFVRALCDILCVHLAPAAVRLSRPTPINVEGSSNDWEKANLASLDRPTTSQLHAMSASAISCFDGDRRSSAPGRQISDGKAAMGILQLLVQRYANSGNHIAVEVAAALLDLDGGRAALPLWITNLLTGTGQGSDGGSENIPTNRGLFASKSSNRGSAGNPVALLKLYMDRGMYVESCRLVTSVLVGSDGGEGRRARSSQRLPEKGDIDFVPYSYIDVLWKLTESATASGSGLTVSSKKKILEARDEMEGALRFHFEMIALSEVGLQSARVLAKGS